MKIVITGGAGFIGCNTAAFYLKNHADVVVFDNLSRVHAQQNLEWLQGLGGSFTFVQGDIRSIDDVGNMVAFLKHADAVIHLAGQVAVTTSFTDPRQDFEINLMGTFNLLEAMRRCDSRAKLIYSSTNKVYGNMENVSVIENTTRYDYVNSPFGISEKSALDFHSPYGCSKGAADQYVHDYGRMYGLDTVVMRQSCIYGPRQFGHEDQGWVAWFMIASALGKPLVIYGNGKQVRDVLYIDDLVAAYDLAIKAGKKTKGEIYNIGGGRKHSISVWHEFGPLLERFFNRAITPSFQNWRPGDQKVFIADIRKSKKDFGWEPKVEVVDGMTRLHSWVMNNFDILPT